MPIYPFKNEVTGEIKEVIYSMTDAPSIGTTVLFDGIGYVRISSDFTVDDGFNRYQYPYVSNSLPRKLNGCDLTAAGKPIIMSRRHERNIASMHGYDKE
jgi:hypothetical protein